MTSDAATECVPPQPPDTNVGKSIISFLRRNMQGANLYQIMDHLKVQNNRQNSSQLTDEVMTILQNGIEMGFLERKGSQYFNWVAQDAVKRKGRYRRRPSKRCQRRGRTLARRSGLCCECRRCPYIMQRR